MCNISAKEQLPIVKTVGGVNLTTRVPFWQQSARYFHHFINRIFQLEKPVKNESKMVDTLLWIQVAESLHNYIYLEWNDFFKSAYIYCNKFRVHIKVNVWIMLNQWSPFIFSKHNFSFNGHNFQKKGNQERVLTY